MFTISKEHLDETRIEKREPGTGSWPFVDIIGSNPPEGDSKPQNSSTQRVFVSEDQITTSAPTSTGTPRPQQTPSQRRNAALERKAQNAAARKKKEKITIISICSAAAVLLIAVIIIIVSTLSGATDNGLIYDNVFAAGVDLSGMTKTQAIAALREATDDTYSKLDMTVQVLDASITLSPSDTDARLDVVAVAQAAYDYGRTGSRSQRQEALKLLKTSPYALPLEEYLTLDTGYIQKQLEELGKQFSVPFTPSSHAIVDGTRPSANPEPETVDLDKVYQTLRLRIGVPEYEYRADRVLQQIMDAYSQNLFQVTGECKVKAAPDPLDCEAIFSLYCTAPVDAVMDPETFQVTPEVYGYGISLPQLKQLVSEAKYGDELNIPLQYLEPDITTGDLSENLFKDTLAAFQSSLSGGADWKNNVLLASQAINGLILKAGEEFSFNQIVGEPTLSGGYKSVSLYYGKSMTSMVGGGISQLATALYNCAMRADLSVLERYAHTYAPAFVAAGLDAQVYYGAMDLRFKNTTNQPIRIEASVSGDALLVQFIGTDSKTYTVDVVYEIDKTKKPEKEYITLTDDNPGGYKDATVYSTGITGYDVSVYRLTYDKVSGAQTGKTLLGQTSYAKRNDVIIHVIPAPNTQPTEPGSQEGTAPSESPSQSESTSPSGDPDTTQGADEASTADP